MTLSEEKDEYRPHSAVTHSRLPSLDNSACIVCTFQHNLVIGPSAMLLSIILRIGDSALNWAVLCISNQVLLSEPTV